MKKYGQFAWSIIQILIGNTLYAASVVLFVIPLGLITCGTTGIALFVNRLTGFDITWFTYILYAVTFLLGLIFLGKRFALTTLISSVWYPVIFSVLEHLLRDCRLTENLILGTFYAGLLTGVGLGMVLRTGSSTGGTDIPVLIVHRYLRVPVSLGIWVLDVAILISQMFIATTEEILYGLLMVILYSIVIDRLLLLGRGMMQVTVISEKQKELTESILTDVERGVTLLHGRTGYTGTERDVVMTVVADRELAKVESIVRKTDPGAFMVVHRVHDVRGYGFSYDKPYREEPPKNEKSD